MTKRMGCPPNCSRRKPGCQDNCRDYKIYKLWIAMVNARKKSAQHRCFHDEFQDKYKGRR